MNQTNAAAKPRISIPLMYGIAAAVTFGAFALDAWMGSAFAGAAPAGGAGTQVFTNLQAKGTDFFYNSRTIILIVMSIGLLLCLVAAISGRFPMGRVVNIAGAIVAISVVSGIVTYFAAPGNTGASALVPSFQDTGAN